MKCDIKLTLKLLLGIGNYSMNFRMKTLVSSYIDLKCYKSTLNVQGIYPLARETNGSSLASLLPSLRNTFRAVTIREDARGCQTFNTLRTCKRNGGNNSNTKEEDSQNNNNNKNNTVKACDTCAVSRGAAGNGSA